MRFSPVQNGFAQRRSSRAKSECLTDGWAR
jgi:hypothetical protein